MRIHILIQNQTSRFSWQPGAKRIIRDDRRGGSELGLDLLAHLVAGRLEKADTFHQKKRGKTITSESCRLRPAVKFAAELQRKGHGEAQCLVCKNGP
ncbi:hypothetical protein [Thiocapsa bogorovii]|uniref:hypothetical protein n=1 Tax=Thiocapsa bogorovii TaxID=521689 RepID=UPI001E55A0C4|nr:hypothetical protein [Thiocapsa bogorovii]UHD16364.1 hypothetical protein LT988_24505 [Thiocapsa bogorovii]